MSSISPMVAVVGNCHENPYCESQQSLVNLLTSSIFTLLSFVRSSSPWEHLHLSPSFDVLNHTNHIFSESLSSGDDTDMVEMDVVDMDIGHGIHGHGGHGHG